jgi:hypothetical protein
MRRHASNTLEMRCGDVVVSDAKAEQAQDEWDTEVAMKLRDRKVISPGG